MRLATTREEILALLNEKAAAGKAKETPLLSEFSRDLTEAAARGALDPLVGRDEELERVIQVLCRRTRNNPVLIGEPGVGKTALVEGLATKIVHGDVPVYLAEKRILALDISLIVAGTKYRGQFEERLKTIMRELTETPNIIIFIDELHTLVGAGSAEGSLDAANILKPALSRGEIQCIGATTPAEYRKHIEKDRALERRFQAVKVASPTEIETVEILRGVKERYEKFHNVLYLDEAIEAAVYQSSRYITDRFLPDKAIDLIDEAGSRVKLREAGAPALVPELSGRVRVVLEADGEGRGGFFREEEQGSGQPVHVLSEQWTLGGEGRHSVGKGDIDEVVSRWTGIPITSLKEEESEKLLRMEEELHRRIVSQDGAISAVARAIRRTRAGLKNPNRPVGSFLFLGPTGVGKTEVARGLAAFLFGSERALMRFDMSEYMEKHSVSKLIGSPPGYVGHDEGGQLTERVKRNPYCVVLLDEIEKAHPDIFNVLLQVFEDGHLTDGIGNTVDFKNTMLIMTSNIGARFIEKKGRMGFAAGGSGEVVAGDERDGDGRGEAHLQPRVHQPHRRDHHLRRAHRPGPGRDHAAAGRAAQPEPEGEGDHDNGRRRRRRVAARPHARATAATARGRCGARSSATSRTRSRRRSSGAGSGAGCRSRWGSRTEGCGTSRASRAGRCRRDARSRHLRPRRRRRGRARLGAARRAGAGGRARDRARSRSPTTSSCSARRCSSTSRRRRASPTTRGSCARTSSGCGTPASWTTCASRPSTGRAARWSRSS